MTPEERKIYNRNYKKKYRENNKEEIKLYKQLHYEENKEHFTEYKKEYYKNNKDRMKEKYLLQKREAFHNNTNEIYTGLIIRKATPENPIIVVFD